MNMLEHTKKVTIAQINLCETENFCLCEILGAQQLLIVMTSPSFTQGQDFILMHKSFLLDCSNIIYHIYYWSRSTMTWIVEGLLMLQMTWGQVWATRINAHEIFTKLPLGMKLLWFTLRVLSLCTCWKLKFESR